MRFSIFLAVLIASVVSSHVARAETELVKIGHCATQGIEMSILSAPGSVPADGDMVQILSSEISPLTGLNLSTGAYFRATSRSFDLPHWNPRSLSLDDCQMTKALPFAAPSDPLQEEMMYIQQFFIYGNPRPDIDIDDLYRRGEAFPIKVHVICRTRTPGGGVLACEEARILDTIIPVETPPQRGQPPLPPAMTSAVVKISSGLCSTSERLESSGVFVDVDGRLLVVTSAGAVVSEFGANSCTTATDENGNVHQLKLVRHDWSMNLASLEAAQGTRVVAMKLRPANAVDPLLTVKVRGQEMAVLAETSSRHFIPSLDRAMELQGAMLDSTAAGLPAIDANGAIAAILSDSHLKMFPGSLTRPQRWMKGERGDHVIAIPAKSVAAWLASYPPVNGRLWALPESQFTPPLKMKSGHLVAEEHCPPLDTTIPHADYPIGGKDAVGIGGDSTGYRACTIRFSIDERGNSSFFNPSFQVWHDGAKAALFAGHRVEVPFFGSRSMGTVERAYLYSTAGFFQELNLPAIFPVEVRTTPGGTVGTEANLAKLRALAVDLASSARYVYANFQTGDLRIGALVRRLFFFGSLAQSENWRELSVADLDAALDPNGSDVTAWYMIESVAVGGKHLKQVTIDLRDEMKRVSP